MRPAERRINIQIGTYTLICSFHLQKPWIAIYCTPETLTRRMQKPDANRWHRRFRKQIRHLDHLALERHRDGLTTTSCLSPCSLVVKFRPISATQCPQSWPAIKADDSPSFTARVGHSTARAPATDPSICELANQHCASVAVVIWQPPRRPFPLPAVEG